MSKLKLTVSRLLALGGLTAVSGATLAFYRHSQLGDSAECRPAAKEFVNFSYKDTDLLWKHKAKWDDNWDFRKIPIEGTKSPENDGDRPEALEPTATRHVILVRHGQYYRASSDAHRRTLTELGRKQAMLTGERLKSLNACIDKITTSTKIRAIETADIIGNMYPGVPVDRCSLLPEGFPFPPEPAPCTWREHESRFFEDNARIEAAFRKYIHRADSAQKEDSFEIVVCHGNVISYFVCRALQFPPEGWLRMSIGNCGITWLSIRHNGRVSLRSLNDTGHIPTEMLTFF